MKIVPPAAQPQADFYYERVIYLFLVAHSANVWDIWYVATRQEAEGVRVCVEMRGQTFTDTFALGAEPLTNAIYPASATDRGPGKYFKPPAHAC
jgi:hypothetical protein